MSKVVLFDCDGTLVDSERICNVGLADMFRSFGVELNPDELVKKFRGGKLANILNALSSEYNVSLPEDFVENYRNHLSTLYKSSLEPIEGVQDTLAAIQLPMGVVSNGPKSKVELAISVCGISDFFGANIFSAYDIEVWKPDPQLYFYAAKEMGFPPNDCIVVEDGLVGVEAGVKAGMRTLFFNRHGDANTFQKDDVVEFDSMEELPGLIKNLL